MQSIDVRKVIDEARLSRFHGKVLAWCVLIIIIDGYDIAIAGIALPSIMQKMGVDASTAGFMASSTLFGMMFGAIFLGAWSARIGRRRTIAICVFLFSVFTAAAGFTTDPISFSVIRFIAGLGIGGVLPNIVAQMTEYSPRKVRSLMTTAMSSGYALGGILAAVLGKQLIGDYGWQAVFLAAGAPIVLVPFILKSLPESLPYLAARDNDRSLHQIMHEIEPRLELSPKTRFQIDGVGHVEAIPVRRLFQDGRGVSTAMFWVAFFTGLFMMYALSSWLTKLMAMSGYSLGSAMSFVLVLNMGAIAGALSGGWLADRFHIKWVLVAMYALGSVFLYLLTIRMPVELLYFVIAMVGACSTGAQLIAYSYCGQYYPAAISATGVGMASGIGRLGAIFAPVVIGQIIALKLPLEQNFLVISAAGIMGALALACIDHNRSEAASALPPEPQAQQGLTDPLKT